MSKLTKLITVFVLLIIIKAMGFDETIIVPHEGQPNNYDGFGRSVFIEDDLTIIGAYYDDGEDVYDEGAVYIYRLVDNEWSLEQKLHPEEGVPDGCFGVFVWSDGEEIIVGANNDLGSGAVYTYSNNGSEWVQNQRFTPYVPGTLNDFGYHISIDEQFMFVGAPGDDELAMNAGVTFIYEKVDGLWVETQKLLAPDGGEFDNFGQYHAIEGNFAVISSFLDNEERGSLYTYNYNGSEWVFGEKIEAEYSQVGDWFGRYIVIDQGKIYVSSTQSDDNGYNAGKVSIYSNDGGEWVLEQELMPSNCSPLANFGESISISEDKLVVGAISDDEMGYNSGAAFLYQFNGDGWVLSEKIMASNGAQGDMFGESVYLDNDRLVVGAYFKDWSGVSYIYNLVDSSAPQIVSLSGNTAHLGDNMDLQLTLSDDTGVSYVNATYTIEGSNYTIPMSPITKKISKQRDGAKEISIYGATIEAYNYPIEGTIVFEMSDTSQPPYTAISDPYPIVWKVPNIIMLEEGFEGETFPPTGWSINDYDGDGYNWESSIWNPYSGEKYAHSASFTPETQNLTPDNFLILPQLDSPDIISYAISAQDLEWGAEKYGVFISYTDDNPESFTEIFSETLNSKSPSDWLERSIELPATDGDVYLAFRHYDCTGQYYLNLDDVVVEKYGSVSVDENKIRNFTLSQNYPNPFNPTTSINFSIEKRSNVNLSIFNSKGEFVKTVVNTQMENGSHSINFDGSNLNSGIYFYKLSVDGQSQIGKMSLIK